MYKVLVVDDEKVMRLAIKTMIKWEENGFELVGEAKDGMAALLIVERYKPDIIITDLKMPNMDGITLIKRLKEQNYRGKILVLSNYGDFDLVRDAMKWGASDYLLKVTMKADELIRILNEIVLQIEDGKIKEERTNTSGQDISGIKRRMLRQALEGDRETEPPEREFEELDIPARSSQNVLLYIFVDHMEQALASGKVNDKEVCISSILNIVMELISSMNGAEIINLSYKDYVLIVPARPSEARNFDACTLAKKIISTIGIYTNLSVSIAVSKEFYGLNAAEAVKACRDALPLKFYIGDASIIETSKTPQFSNQLAAFDFTNIISEVKLTMESGQLSQVIALFEGLFNKAANDRSNPEDLKVLITLLLNSLIQLLTGLGEINIDFIDKNKALLGSSETLEEYKAILNELLLEIFNRIQDLKKSTYRKEVNLVIDYIRMNIRSKITLNSIAKRANMNESYLCRLFKKETGKSIFGFSNEMKVLRAQELLRESGAVVKNVAIAVGIDDQLYFNRVFKKYSGTSPTQYKESILSERKTGE